MGKPIQLTNEAYEVLENIKSEGSSLKLLASQAVMQVYGAHGQGQSPAPTTGWVYLQEPTVADYKEAARLLKLHGHPIKAIASLHGENADNKRLAMVIKELGEEV